MVKVSILNGSATLSVDNLELTDMVDPESPLYVAMLVEDAVKIAAGILEELDLSPAEPHPDLAAAKAIAAALDGKITHQDKAPAPAGGELVN